MPRKKMSESSPTYAQASHGLSGEEQDWGILAESASKTRLAPERSAHVTRSQMRETPLMHMGLFARVSTCLLYVDF